MSKLYKEEGMDFQKLLEQAQQMQNSLQQTEQELNEKKYTGKTGGSNGVSITINGTYEVEEVNISEELMDVENREMLQDMILIAMNDAIDQANAEREEKMGSITQGLNIPGM